MYLSMILPLLTLHMSQQVASTPDSCVCELKNLEEPFPHDRLSRVEETALKCNQDLSSRKSREFGSLQLGVERRLAQLVADVSELEREDDGDLYGAVTLQVIQNELTEILYLLNKLNSTTFGYQRLNMNISQELQGIKYEMQQLEAFDLTQTVKRQQINKRLRRELETCMNGHHSTIPTVMPAAGACPHGQFLNVSGPKIYAVGEYPGSYKYGAWGRDPKPDVGKESWYWLVMLTTSNIYSHYVRRYSSLSALIVGISVPGNVMISPTNPTTNTIQGPNVVLYGEALYYNCYKVMAICRFNLTAKSVTSTELPQGTRFNSKGNFCNLEACYPYTDLDMATDETGVWVVYTTTGNHGNLVLSRVEEEGQQPVLGRTWHTSLYKQAATNTFVACGVLYATRYISEDMEEIFYSFDTVTGVERFDVGVRFHKMKPHIYSLNYSPVDQMLHVYGESVMTSYKVVFGSVGRGNVNY